MWQPGWEEGLGENGHMCKSLPFHLTLQHWLSAIPQDKIQNLNKVWGEKKKLQNKEFLKFMHLLLI